MQTVADAMTSKSDLVALTINALSGGSTPEGLASVFVALLRELAKGLPVSVRTLADASGQPHWARSMRSCVRRPTSSTTRWATSSATASRCGKLGMPLKWKGES